MVKLQESGKEEAGNWDWSMGYNAKLAPENAFFNSCRTATFNQGFVLTNEVFLLKHNP
ncbi:MAG: hypothetical protein MJK13_08895 [Pseudomonadales bacterium]|nr:hypothetical protein [Pseudomonadales bacterium]